MIATAAVGPMFKVGEMETNRGVLVNTYFRTLTLALMGSRIVLALQYLQTWYFMREHKHIKKPMMINIATYCISAAIYLGLVGSLFIGSISWVWIAWYIVGVFESVTIVYVSCKWRALSFKGTHLAQRMSLLTLIILGEGAISVGKQCQVIVGASMFRWNVLNAIDIACAVAILYFLYQLYFDWLEEERHFGSIRQQIWAGLHFPLHLTLVLAVQGLSLCIVWGAAIALVHDVNNKVGVWTPSGMNPNIHWETNLTSNDWHEAVTTWQHYYPVFQDSEFNTKDVAAAIGAMNDQWRFNAALAVMEDFSTNASTDATAFDARRAYELANYTLYTSIYTLAGFGKKKDLQKEVEELASDTIDLHHPMYDMVNGSKVENVRYVMELFELTYVYFFLSVGCAVMLCTGLAILSSHGKRRAWHWLRLGGSMTIGLTLALMTSLAAGNRAVYYRFIRSPFVLPLVMLLLFVGESRRWSTFLKT